jgi:hypothetical protein
MARVFEGSPSSPEAYAHLGLLESRQGHYKEAALSIARR